MQVIGLWLLWLWWLMAHDGAENLVDVLGLSDKWTLRPTHVVWLACTGAVVWMAGMALISRGYRAVSPWTDDMDGYTTVFTVLDGMNRLVALVAFFVVAGIVGVGESILRFSDTDTRQSVRDGRTVELRNFGVFKVKSRRPRIGRNPKTGAMVPIPERKVVSFKAGMVMKKKVK